MKLNNHGWGTKELIISAVIIFLLLLVCGYYIHRLYEAMEYDRTHPVEESSYTYNGTNTSTSTNTGTNTNIGTGGNTSNSSNSSTEYVPEENSESSSITNIDYTYYKDYESRMSNAATSYVRDYDITLGDGNILVTMTDLVDLNYITMLYDKYDGSLCEGYTIISQVGNTSSYLKCTNYVTEGY